MKLVDFRPAIFATFLMLWSIVVWAAATTTAVSGSVDASGAQGASVRLAIGQRIESGVTVKTGENSSVVFRFDDGQVIALVANSTLVVNDYHFQPHKPTESGFFSTLVKGGLRAVTGVIGEANKQNVSIKTTAATVGIRGTDFNLYLEDRLFMQVLEGAISAANAGGEAVFAATENPLGVAASASTVPRPIEPGELPAGALAAFRQLSAIPITGKERLPDANDPTCRDRR